MSKKQKQKGAVAAVVCFVAAIAIAGTYTFNDYQKSKNEQKIAKAEETDSTREESQDTVTDLIINTEETAIAEKEPETAESELVAESSVATAAEKSTAVNFSSESQMLWPVDGDVLMSYSMDQTVYFKTLDQYKYNPAMVIAAAEGDQVMAGAPGTVKSIDNSAQTGTTVNVDLGNGYEVFYGQLKDVTVNVGDYVEAKTVLGYVSTPTKYYNLEGTNVYFEMRKDGQPINPMEFLEA